MKKTEGLSKRFWNALSDWSQATFGSDETRGPLGPLKHLRKEADEAIEQYMHIQSEDNDEADPELKAQALNQFKTELVDCQFLIFDSARRHGMSHKDLFKAAMAKLEVNKKRSWPKPSEETKYDPVEHIKESSE